MADVSLDDLIKKDKEQHKASRNNKVSLNPFRSLLKRSSLPVGNSKATVIRNNLTKILVNKAKIHPLRKNLYRKDSKRTGIPKENQESRDRISSKTSPDRIKKRMRINKNSSEL